MSEISRAGAIRGAMPFAAGRESARVSDRSVSTQGDAAYQFKSSGFFSEETFSGALQAASRQRRLEKPGRVRFLHRPGEFPRMDTGEICGFVSTALQQAHPQQQRMAAVGWLFE